MKIVKKIKLEINIDKMSDEWKKEITDIPKYITDQIEQAVVSSYIDEKTPNNPIKSDEQRKINRLMDELENNWSGACELSDVTYAFLITKWNERKIRPLSGDIRRAFHRIDMLLCPEEFKENTDKNTDKRTVENGDGG